MAKKKKKYKYVEVEGEPEPVKVEVEDDDEELREDVSTSKQYSKDDLIKVYEAQIEIISKRLEDLKQPTEEEKKLIALELEVADLKKYVEVHHKNLETLNENFKLLLEDRK